GSPPGAPSGPLAAPRRPNTAGSTSARRPAIPAPGHPDARQAPRTPDRAGPAGRCAPAVNRRALSANPCQARRQTLDAGAPRAAQATKGGARMTRRAAAGGGGPVGAVGGMTAALSLLQVGFDVHVYEQASRLTEVGAGVQVSPNASRVLHRLGLAGELARAGVKPLAWHQRRWDDGRTLQRAPLAEAL